METKTCATCNEKKSVTEFEPDRRVRKNGKQAYLKNCLVCHRERRNKNARDNYNPEVQKNGYLKRKYGITLSDYNEMLKKQHGVCGICGGAATGKFNRTSLHVDHDHACCGKNKGCKECIRGLLCGQCNTALGGFSSIAMLEKAIAYLKGNDHQ